MAMATGAIAPSTDITSINTEAVARGANGSAPHSASGTPVSAIRVGSEDGRGVAVEKIYSLKDRCYVVYRAADQMMVHFADDVTLANEQRKSLAGLAGMRAQLSMLTVDMPQSAAYYDGQIAHALQLALDGDPEKGKEILTQTVAGAERERAGRGRIQYLLYGLATAALFLAILGIGYAAVSFAKPANNLWLAAIGGAIGAVFSMSIAIRSRAVALDLYRNANIADGALRILVGVISAGVLVLLMATNIVPDLQVGGGALTGETATWETILLVGFIAGFLERLLPDLLNGHKGSDTVNGKSKS